jgi:hypothetical protein
VRELRADLHRIASQPYPSSWAKERMRAEVEAQAMQGEPDCTALLEHGLEIKWPVRRVEVTVFNAQPGAVGYAEIPDMLAIEAWRNKEAIIKQLTALIDAESDDKAALSQADRELRTAEVLGDLAEIEFHEGAWYGADRAKVFLWSIGPIVRRSPSCK